MISHKIIKKSLVAVISFSLMLSVVACDSGDETQSKMDNTNNVENAINQQIASEQQYTDEMSTEATTEATTQATTQSTLSSVTDADIYNSDIEGVDIDLTAMDSNMVYSTVYQMMANSTEFDGKVVRMEGSYYASYDENMQQMYYFVIIQDATACCQQGLEFIWGDGSHVYPDEYPEDGTEVIVTGTFETYKDHPDDVYSYVHLKDSELEIVASAQ